jgi:hypothetical protein
MIVVQLRSASAMIQMRSSDGSTYAERMRAPVTSASSFALIFRVEFAPVTGDVTGE